MKCFETIKNKVKEKKLPNWICEKYFPELKQLFKLAWPIILMNLFRFLNPVISVIMCGHLKKTQFDAASLANVLIQAFGTSIDLGFSTACDTLFSQIYGSSNRKRLGLMLQRAFIVMTITYLILACFHLNIEPLLILLSQDVEISRLAANYVTLYLPGLFFDFHFMTISRYLQNQNIVLPMMISSGVGCIYNIIVQYIAIYVLGYGIEASAVIQASGCFVMFMIQFIYVLVSKIYKSTWQGFEFCNALQGWESFFKLGIPGIVMISIEEWTFEVGSLIAGAISDSQLGGQSVAMQTAFLCYMIHSGFSIAVTIRIGQFLGSNKPVEAKLSAKTNIITDLSVSVVTSTMLFSLRKYLPYIFTNDKDIQKVAEELLLFVAFIQFLDAAASSCAAIMRACGKQLIGAIVMFFSYYFIGVPIAVILIFLVSKDIIGFWIGIMIGLAVEVFIYIIIVLRINWKGEALKTRYRIEESKLVESRIDRIFDNEDEEEEENDNVDEDDNVTEKTNLIMSIENLKNNEKRENLPTERLFRPSHRRPTSSVTDIIVSDQIEACDTLLDQKIDKITILKRIILVGIVLFLFILSIFLKIYLPRRLYIPCISGNNTNLSLDKHYPYCNDTLYIV